MAYGLKYTIPFKDIDNLSNVVEIYQDGFAGTVTELIATDQPATHKYEREDNEDLTSSIMSCTFTISFYSTDTTDFRNFFSYSDREFLVVHKFEGNVVFKGYLLNDITGEPFQDPPYPVVITATDGLAQLKEVALTGPDVDTELGSLIIEQLNRLELDLNLEVCNDLYEGLVMDKTKSIFDQAEGEQLLVQADTFTDLELNAFDFLLEVCKTYGWVLMQSNGRWLIQRAIARNIDTTEIFVHSYVDGSVIESYPNNTVSAIENWTTTEIQSGGLYRSIVYGNGIFVAIGGAFISTSTDGINWTTNPSFFGGLNDAIFANGLFVAVGYVVASGVPTGLVYTSSDGLTWTQRTVANNNVWQSITFGNGLFVAVAQPSTVGAVNLVMTSPNGITWTSRNVPATYTSYRAIAYGNNKFVIVGGGPILNSTDGISWTTITATVSALNLIYDNNIFTTGTSYSTDGVNWFSTNIVNTPQDIAFGNGYFVSVRRSGTNQFAYSQNGTTWTEFAEPFDDNWSAIGFGNNRFVIAQNSGSGDSLYTILPPFGTLETIADQTNANVDWIPVNADQLLQYQRPIKKLTVTQGDLGQSIIANGESFNENSWTLDGYYKPNEWTINVDPANVPQIFPENIPSQATWDDEKGVSWDFRFIPSTYTIESTPIFLDNAGLIIDFEAQVDFELSNGSVVFYFKHTDINDNVTYLSTAPIVGKEVLTWASPVNGFSFNSTKDEDSRTFKVSSFILPAPGFLSIEMRGGPNGDTIIKTVKMTPTYLGKKNPSEVKKIYETARAYTSLREDTLKFSDLCIAASKNWFRIGGLPAIVFIEKSLASTPDIIQVPSGAVSQVNKLTDTLLTNTLSYSGGFMAGTYSRQYTAAAGFTIDSVEILKGDLLNTGNTAADLGTYKVVISSTQVNVVYFDGVNYDVTEQGNAQITITLKDDNNNVYQISTFLFQVRDSGGGIETYDLINISFEAQATDGSYSPTLRDCYARNVLTLYNALSYRLEGSFRRAGNTFGNAYLPSQLVYTGYSTVRLQVIGWEYDLATRVARITFGQVPTAYVYPIS